MQLITNLVVGLGMAELALVDYFVMGEAIGILGCVILLFKKANAKTFNRHRNQDLLQDFSVFM